MGIECGMYQIAPDDLETILGSEDAFENFVDFLFPETLDEGEAIEYSSMEENSLDLGKIWDLVHYLITGDPYSENYPLAYAVMVGYQVHESNWSFLPYDQVKEVAESLAALSDGDLRKVGETRPIPKIYKTPSISEDDIEEAFGYFHRLKDYYQDAANNGNSILRVFC